MTSPRPEGRRFLPAAHCPSIGGFLATASPHHADVAERRIGRFAVTRQKAFLAVSPTSPILDGVNTIIHAVLVDQLLSRRGSVGGWGYRSGGQYSAEATALATLAGWHQLDTSTRTSILDYWKNHQLPDGGWSSIGPLSSGGKWPTAIIANTLAQVAPRHPCLRKALQSPLSLR